MYVKKEVICKPNDGYYVGIKGKEVNILKFGPFPDENMARKVCTIVNEQESWGRFPRAFSPCARVVQKVYEQQLKLFTGNFESDEIPEMLAEIHAYIVSMYTDRDSSNN